MTDNAFPPETIEVDVGDEVTFRFRNEGNVDHDAIIGNADEQADDEHEMNGDNAPGEDHGTDMTHEAGDTEAITVRPGETGNLTHRFETAGTILIGCHEPGHYEAGMRAEITVT